MAGSQNLQRMKHDMSLQKAFLTLHSLNAVTEIRILWQKYIYKLSMRKYWYNLFVCLLLFKKIYTQIQENLWEIITANVEIEGKL